MAHLSFYLRPTRDPEVGILAHYLIDGSKVLERRSYRVKVFRNLWDNQRGRVLPQHPNSNSINQLIEDSVTKFDPSLFTSSSDPEKQCLLGLMDRFIEMKRKHGCSTSSIFKYKIVRRNVEKSIVREFGTPYFPIGNLRDISIIDKLKDRMRERASHTVNPKNKTNAGLQNYLGFLAQVVEYWNARSGVQIPINTKPLRPKLGRDLPPDPQKIVETITWDDFEKLKKYKPSERKRGCQLEAISLSIFKFQMFTGGIRWIDAVFLTNHHYDSGHIVFLSHKKGRKISKVVNWDMAMTLSDLYPYEFQQARTTTRMTKEVFNLQQMVELQRFITPVKVSNLDMNDIDDINRMISGPVSESLLSSINEVSERLRHKAAMRFFNLIKHREKGFLFPILQLKDFTEEKILTKQLTDKQLRQLNSHRVNHNNALKRITKKIGIKNVTCHTPRHTMARECINLGWSESEVMKLLGHKHLSTTHHYIHSRHPLTAQEHKLQELFRSRISQVKE